MYAPFAFRDADARWPRRLTLQRRLQYRAARGSLDTSMIPDFTEERGEALYLVFRCPLLVCYTSTSQIKCARLLLTRSTDSQPSATLPDRSLQHTSGDSRP